METKIGQTLLPARHLDTNDPSTMAKYALMELGIPTKLAGYHCLILGLSLLHDDPDQSFTKQLYPEIGRLCTPRISGRQVEKLIRYAIDVAWANRDSEVWNHYFPQKTRPTNGEFMSKVAQLLELWQICGEMK